MQCIWLILGDSAWCWMVSGNFGLFYDLCYLKHLFLVIFFLIIDSFKVLFLFPLHIRSQYQEYAFYANTDKGNIIHTKIQTQRIKLKEVSVSRTTKSY